MKTRPTIVTILAALLSCLSAGCAKSTPKNRLDIVLEGPWILYQDLQFDNRGKKIPVLVAIAPNGVSATAVHKHGKDGVAEANSAHSHADDGDQLHHHLPQQVHPGIVLRIDVECLDSSQMEMSGDEGN